MGAIMTSIFVSLIVSIVMGNIIGIYYLKIHNDRWQETFEAITKETIDVIEKIRKG